MFKDKELMFKDKGLIFKDKELMFKDKGLIKRAMQAQPPKRDIAHLFSINLGLSSMSIYSITGAEYADECGTGLW
jgi:hypothetical protein